MARKDKVDAIESKIGQAASKGKTIADMKAAVELYLGALSEVENDRFDIVYRKVIEDLEARVEDILNRDKISLDAKIEQIEGYLNKIFGEKSNLKYIVQGVKRWDWFGVLGDKYKERYDELVVLEEGGSEAAKEALGKAIECYGKAAKKSSKKEEYKRKEQELQVLSDGFAEAAEQMVLSVLKEQLEKDANNLKAAVELLDLGKIRIVKNQVELLHLVTNTLYRSAQSAEYSYTNSQDEKESGELPMLEKARSHYSLALRYLEKSQVDDNASDIEKVRLALEGVNSLIEVHQKLWEVVDWLKKPVKEEEKGVGKERHSKFLARLEEFKEQPDIVAKIPRYYVVLAGLSYVVGDDYNTKPDDKSLTAKAAEYYKGAVNYYGAEGDSSKHLIEDHVNIARACVHLANIENVGKIGDWDKRVLEHLKQAHTLCIEESRNKKAGVGTEVIKTIEEMLIDTYMSSRNPKAIFEIIDVKPNARPYNAQQRFELCYGAGQALARMGEFETADKAFIKASSVLDRIQKPEEEVTQRLAVAIARATCSAFGQNFIKAATVLREHGKSEGSFIPQNYAALKLLAAYGFGKHELSQLMNRSTEIANLPNCKLGGAGFWSGKQLAEKCSALFQTVNPDKIEIMFAPIHLLQAAVVTAGPSVAGASIFAARSSREV